MAEANATLIAAAPDMLAELKRLIDVVVDEDVRLHRGHHRQGGGEAMKVLDVEQGSRAWVEARLGLPTASNAKRIVTSTGKLSAQRDKPTSAEAARGVGHRRAGYDEVLRTTHFMARGKALEPAGEAPSMLSTRTPTLRDGRVSSADG